MFSLCVLLAKMSQAVGVDMSFSLLTTGFGGLLVLICQIVLLTAQQCRAVRVDMSELVTDSTIYRAVCVDMS